MSAAYIDTTFVDRHIGQDARLALFDDGAGYEAATLTALINTASAILKAALQNAGYSPGDSTTSDLVKIATFGQFVLMAYGRKGLKVPDQFATSVALAEGIRSGAVPVPDTDPSTRDGVGGVLFTDSSDTTSTGKPAIFSRDNLRW